MRKGRSARVAHPAESRQGQLCQLHRLPVLGVFASMSVSIGPGAIAFTVTRPPQSKRARHPCPGPSGDGALLQTKLSAT